METVAAFRSKLFAPVGAFNNLLVKLSQPTSFSRRKISARGFATLAASIALLAISLSGCNGVVHTTTTTPNGNGSSDPTAPAITTQPVSQTVSTGQIASFSVIATGTAPLSYQWQRNGVNIAGATSSSY